MSLYILVKTGEDAGVRFEVKPNLKIGRKNADFILKDRSASSNHAQIKQIAPGQFTLVDQGSKNGIHSNGLREYILPLEAGSQFILGETSFEVVEDAPSPPLSIKAERPELEETLSPEEPSFENSQIVEVDVSEDWNDVLENFSQITLPRISNKFTGLLPMNPAVKITFLRGIKTNTEWLLGYGPRVVGAGEYDLTIFEPDAPKNCFELIPSDEGVNFKTNHPKNILYNGRSNKQSLLKDGDTITIGNSLIKVELIK